MRKPEQRLYDWLQRKIGHVAMLERVENRVKKDTPDLYLATQVHEGTTVSRLAGWVELKVLEAFPARATTPVRIDHWTTGQRFWALRHRQRGGTTWLVVEVVDAGQIYVFDAAEMATEGQAWTMADWGKYGQMLDRRNDGAGHVLAALQEFVL